jgi:hypothetical protein
MQAFEKTARREFAMTLKTDEKGIIAIAKNWAMTYADNSIACRMGKLLMRLLDEREVLLDVLTAAEKLATSGPCQQCALGRAACPCAVCELDRATEAARKIRR